MGVSYKRSETWPLIHPGLISYANALQGGADGGS